MSAALKAAVVAGAFTMFIILDGRIIDLQASISNLQNSVNALSAQVRP